MPISLCNYIMNPILTECLCTAKQLWSKYNKICKSRFLQFKYWRVLCLGLAVSGSRECDIRGAQTPKLDPGPRHITVPMVVYTYWYVSQSPSITHLEQ
jgi:hypothetical protein